MGKVCIICGVNKPIEEFYIRKDSKDGRRNDCIVCHRKNKQIYSLDIPRTIVPIPTDDNYSNGIIERYFTQKVNDTNGFVYEINLDTYNELKLNPYWIIQNIKWRLSGPLDSIYDSSGKIIDKGVRNSNTASIADGQKVIKNLNLYLINILQFYK
jgi:hypothetical protein